MSYVSQDQLNETFGIKPEHHFEMYGKTPRTLVSLNTPEPSELVGVGNARYQESRAKFLPEYKDGRWFWEEQRRNKGE